MAPNPKNKADLMLAEDMGRFSRDPLGWVCYSFAWGTGELAGLDGPDVWQTEQLQRIGEQLQAGRGAGVVIQESIASGHGIGKSALVAWLILWALSTFPGAKGIVTANTESQLRKKTWSELAKWHTLFIAKHWFTLTATAIYSHMPAHEKTWRIDQETWSLNNTEAFAGMHNKGKRILLIYDEASAIPDLIWEVSEGVLTDEDTEIIWCVFGNPTRNSGRFRECFAGGKFNERWNHNQIDSRTSKFTNQAQIAKWIADYGEDSDFVRVRVKGQFPRAGNAQFIGSDLVDMAIARLVTPGIGAIKMGVDVARFGDDQTVFYVRQGFQTVLVEKHRGKDTVWTSGRTKELHKLYRVDEIYIDDPGVGGGVTDQVRAMGLNPIPVLTGSAASDAKHYFNQRAELWGAVKAWLVDGGQLPDDAGLKAELIGPEYGFDGRARIQLETKADMKTRGLSSPDCADALALTFSDSGAAGAAWREE